MAVLAHIFFVGIVQGVGFRYTTQNLATELGLLGWVRNLRDGRVEVMVEGEKATILELIEKLENRFEGSIHDKQVVFKEATRQFTEFSIAR